MSLRSCYLDSCPDENGKAHDITEPYTPSWASQIVFWVLGIALFLALGLLPSLLLAWFYTAGEVHLVVGSTVAVILALFWGTARLTPPATR